MPSLLSRLLTKLRHAIEREGPTGPARLLYRKARSLLRALDPERRRLAAEERELDRRYGIDTAGTRSLVDLEGGVSSASSGYQPTHHDALVAMLRALPIDHREFTFVDLGSGKGRVILFASELPFQRIVGVELSRELHTIAVRNLAAYRNPARVCHDVHAICGDATAYPLPEEPLVLYLYNPFRGALMQRVVDNVDASLRDAPRPLYVVYYNPLESALFDRSPRLARAVSGDGYLIWGSRRTAP